MKRGGAGGVGGREGRTMNRLLIRAFELAGLLGCLLSLIGLTLSLWLYAEAQLRRGQGVFGPDPVIGLLTYLSLFRDPGTTFLLSAILCTLCEIALAFIPRRAPKPDTERDFTP